MNHEDLTRQIGNEQAIVIKLEENHHKTCEYCENESTHYNAEVASYICDECED